MRNRLANKFKGRKIRTLQAHETDLTIHVSGHPCQEELKAALYLGSATPGHSLPWWPKAFDAKRRSGKTQSCPQTIDWIGNGDYTTGTECKCIRDTVKVRRIALLR